MTSEAELLRRLELDAQQMKNVDPWVYMELNERVTRLRVEVAQMDDIRAEVMSLASNQARAGQIYADVSRYADDSKNRVSRFASACYAEGLLTDGQFQGIKAKLAAMTSYEGEHQKKMQQYSDDLQRSWDIIYNAVEPQNRREALAIYNQLGETPRTENKLEDWCRRLIEKKMLPVTFKVSMRYSGFLSKMMNPAPENKGR